MSRLRWRKILSDVFENRTRTLLLVLCIAVGVLAIGTIEGGQEVLLSKLDRAYDQAQPASVALTVEPFDNHLVEVVRGVPGVQDAEGRTALVVHLLTPAGDLRDLQLLAVRDFSDLRVGRFFPEAGAFPPPKHELLLERTSLAFLREQVGRTLTVQTPDGKSHDLRLAGTVHDLSQPASALTGSVYGYITLDTLETLGQPRSFNQLLISAPQIRDEAELQRLAAQVSKTVDGHGRRVFAATVAQPHKMWLNDSVASMLLLLGVLGALSLLLSGLLVVTTMNALLAGQVREIGVMKSIGARGSAMLEMFLITVLTFGALALLVAVPLGIVGAYALITYSTALLNLDGAGLAFSARVILLQVLVGLLVPLLAALYPIIAGSRITVREAIGGYGMGAGGFGDGFFDRLLNHVHALPRPFLLSLRNMFRRKGRLALALTTLTLAGAIFIAVLSVRASLEKTLDEIYGYRRFDLQLVFNQPHLAEPLAREALNVPGVSGAESWGMTAAMPLPASGELSDNIRLIGLPADSRFIVPAMYAGRWLQPYDRNALVVDTDVFRNHPWIKIGDTLTLKLGPHETSWQIVGIVRSTLLDPVAYVNYPAYGQAMRQEGMGQSLQVTTAEHDAASQARALAALEDHFSRLGFSVGATQTTADRRQFDAADFDIITGFLTAMAALLAMVGGISLMGTLSINVLERTREIGVLRAIGAPTGSVMQIIIGEGVLIGGLSALLSALVSLPLSRVLADQVGWAFVEAPLTYTFSAEAVALWLALAVGIAALSSFLPALNAAHVTIRDALAYE